jgi:hypothetical protein
MLVAMGSSRFKKAHRTHAFGRRAGESYPAQIAGKSDRRADADGDLLALFSELCSRVPEASERVKLLGVSTALEAAWERGTALPLLRAHRKALERALLAARQPS